MRFFCWIQQGCPFHGRTCAARFASWPLLLQAPNASLPLGHTKPDSRYNRAADFDLSVGGGRVESRIASFFCAHSVDGPIRQLDAHRLAPRGAHRFWIRCCIARTPASGAVVHQRRSCKFDREEGRHSDLLQDRNCPGSVVGTCQELRLQQRPDQDGSLHGLPVSVVPKSF